MAGSCMGWDPDSSTQTALDKRPKGNSKSGQSLWTAQASLLCVWPSDMRACSGTTQLSATSRATNNMYSEF